MLWTRRSDGEWQLVESLSREKHMNEERLIDLREAGRFLGGICARSVERLIAKGELPTPVRPTKKPMLYLSDVQAYLSKLKQRQRGLPA
jgi:predicted DNA-binding transcriptional regulator AlpA